MDAESGAARHALRRYLGLDGVPKGNTRLLVRSSFWALLMDARGAAGRDIKTGEVRDPRMSASWLAAMGYLCWFDQVGTVLKLEGGVKANGFHRCLLHFSDLTITEITALYALRNGFTHGYGLVSPDKNRDKPRHYSFELDVDGPLIEHAEQPWDGTYPIGGSKHSTRVGLRRLGDLAEAVKDAAMQALRDGTLQAAIDPVEMQDRYIFQFYDE